MRELNTRLEISVTHCELNDNTTDIHTYVRIIKNIFYKIILFNPNCD